MFEHLLKIEVATIMKNLQIDFKLKLTTKLAKTSSVQKQ